MPVLVGIAGASAGRSTPLSMPKVACAATTDAPVCPAPLVNPTLAPLPGGSTGAKCNKCATAASPHANLTGE